MPGPEATPAVRGECEFYPFHQYLGASALAALCQARVWCDQREWDVLRIIRFCAAIRWGALAAP